jgi:hypothetical protein
MFSSPPPITATLHDAASSAPRLRANGRRRAPLLSPTLVGALTELAATEGLPLPALIALLINEALDQRLQRCRS